MAAFSGPMGVDEPDPVRPRAWAMLALLGAMYVLSFVDRFILALLVAPLKADLGVSDLQLGLLFGTFFGLFYGILGLPLARLADRGNRKHLIIVGVVIWSSCTLASAFARNYETLAILRFGLAVGEAALTPAAFSLLVDVFPMRRRILAASIFSAAGMAGASGAFLLGAVVVNWAGYHADASGWDAWRIVFVVVGAPGFVLAAIFAFTAREPARGSAATPPTFAKVLRHVRDARRLYYGLFAGAGAAQMVTYAMIAWAPTLLSRVYGLSMPAAGARLGMVQLIAAVGGTLILPTVLRRLSIRRPGTAAWLPAIASAAGAALVASAALMPGVTAFLGIYGAGAFLLIGATNAIIVLLQPIAPPAMRATLTAMLLICISCFGLGLGPPLVALVARLAEGNAQPLIAGLVAVGCAGMIVSAACLAWAARPLRAALAGLR